jgi:hypothetical protein
VIDNAIAKRRSGLSRAMTLLFQNNHKFWSHRGLVRQVPVTWTYLQDFIAKKKAPVARLAVAFLAGVEKGSHAWARMFTKAEAMIAFCCFRFLLSFQ